MGQRGELFTRRVFTSEGERTYFFNVKENRYGDLFLNLAESRKKENNQFERHSLMIYREDIEGFQEFFFRALDSLKNKEATQENNEFHPSSGKRSYQFSVHITRKGDFLLLTEVRRDKDLQFIHETIRIEFDQTDLFTQAFNETVRFLQNSKKKRVVKLKRTKK